MDSWPLKKKETVFKNRFLKLRKERRSKPGDPSVEHDFYVFDMTSWVNVVAVDAEQNIILIRQWRAGTDSESLEIPGGAVDPGESPLEAARRELLEETGYTADRWQEAGVVEPNPAILTNTCHTYLALGAKKTSDPQLEPTEDIEVIPKPLEKVREDLGAGRIRHALVVAALYMSFERLADGGQATPDS